MAEFGNEVSVEQSTKEGTDTRSIAESSLPRGRELVVVRGLDKGAVALGKGRVGVEVGQEVEIVALHDDAHGDDEAPHDGAGVLADGLAGRELVLGAGGLLGVGGGVGADRLQDSRLDTDVLGVSRDGGRHLLGHDGGS